MLFKPSDNLKNLLLWIIEVMQSLNLISEQVPTPIPDFDNPAMVYEHPDLFRMRETPREYLMKIKILNEYGLHQRPAKIVADLCKRYDFDTKAEKEGEGVDAKSILSLMCLGASRNSEVCFHVKKSPEVSAEQVRELFQDLRVSAWNKFFE